MTRAMVRGALLLASVAAALCTLEVLLHLTFHRLPTAFLIYAHRDLKDAHPKAWVELRRPLPFLTARQEDPDVGWTQVPRARLTGANEDGETFDVTASAEGFCTPSVPDKHVPQLVTLGDSFLSTYYVRRPLAWVLQSELGLPVYNLAVGGWGPESYLAAYRKFAADRTHRRVVVFTFLNDITDVLSWNEWKNEEPARESFLTWIQRTNAKQVVNVDGSWLDRFSVLWNYLKFVRRAHNDHAPVDRPLANGSDSTQVHRETFTVNNHALSFQFSTGYPFEELDRQGFEPGGNYYPYLQAYFESLERLKDAIASEHAQMILVWIPSRERVYLPLLPHDRYVRYVTNSSGTLDGLERIMAAYAAQSGITFLDLTPALHEHARAGEQLYFTVDGHLNSAGNELAGRLVAQFLRNAPDSAESVRVSPRLIYRHGPTQLTARLHDSDVTYRTPLVSNRGAGWHVRGHAAGPHNDALRWPARPVNAPLFLVIRGVVREGGVRIGLREEDKWVIQSNVASGRFDLAIPVLHSGNYSVVLAYDLPKTALDTDIEIDDLGWAQVD